MGPAPRSETSNNRRRRKAATRGQAEPAPAKVPAPKAQTVKALPAQTTDGEEGVAAQDAGVIKPATPAPAPKPPKATPTANTQKQVSVLFDEESDDEEGVAAPEDEVIKRATPAPAPTPPDDAAQVLWKALAEKNLRTLTQWLQAKKNKERLKRGTLWNKAGETALYQALSVEFYKGADALVAAVPNCLTTQKNHKSENTPLTFIFDHATIPQLKQLFQEWYTTDEFDPAAMLAGQSIEQRALACGLLESAESAVPAPAPSAMSAAGAPDPSRAEAKPASVKPAASSQREMATGTSLAMLEKLWDADLFFNVNRRSVNVSRFPVIESRVCQAIENNDIKFLRKNEEGVQAYQRFMQHSFLRDSSRSKVWSLSDKYPMALWGAFLADATQSFSYFLSKIDDINPLLFYAEDSSSIFGYLLESIILMPAFLSLGRGGAFSFNASRIAMLAELFKHRTFDYAGRLRKKLASATDENFISRFIQGLVQVGDVDVLSELVFELLRAGVSWEDISGVIQMKYSDNELAQSLMINIAHAAMGLYIKNDLSGFLDNYPCPGGMMASYGFVACIEDLLNRGVGSNGNIELLTGAVAAKSDDSMTAENALSIVLLRWPAKLQKELLSKYLTWAPLENS